MTANTASLTRYSDTEIIAALMLGKTSLLTHTHPFDSELGEVFELPVTREDLLDELSRRPWVRLNERRTMLRGLLYHGKFIYVLPGETVLDAKTYVFGDDGQRRDFNDQAEAEAFIDDSIYLSKRD